MTTTMDYGLPKTLPATGATFATMAFTDQLWILAAVFSVTFLASLAIRGLWRRKKSIKE